MSDWKGYISTEKTVWCGRCGDWDQRALVEHGGHVKQWKKMGWMKTKEHGWVCPSCAKKLKEGSRGQ